MQPFAVMRCRRGLVVVGVLLLPAFGAAQSPSAQWRTYETEHFRVHFPAPFETWARHVASRIESIHARVTDYVGYKPRQRVDVLIEDPAAAANGLAFPFLDRPVIVLWTSPPEPESSVGEFANWPDVLLTHEMTHIVHLLRPRSQSRGLLARFSPLPIGPVLRKSPRWVIEGYATLVEGALTGAGRPQGSFRAMVMRRFAMEGKLPPYRRLSSVSGWIGGSAPYLVGSTYLEWLEAREGKGSLQRLWKRLASRRGGSFATAFRAIFGDSPEDLYDRFRAETTAQALAEERRLKSAGLVEGELWQRLEGGTVSPQVSPDGSRLLARRDPRPGRGEIVIWELEESAAEKRAGERHREREERLLRDPEEVRDRPEKPLPRRPRWRLGAVDGFATREPRWMPDGRHVLFARRSPDTDGVLRSDLYIWDPPSGSVRRVTHLADVAMADPAPDGTFAIGVSNRFGLSRLVRIEIESGRVSGLRAELEREDPWRVWIHSRFSPNGRRLAALAHWGGRWRLVVLEPDGKGLRELPVSGSPIGPPAWTAEGLSLFVATDATGIWNLETVAAGGGSPRFLTRVTGGALSPAPTPDGKELFYLDATAKGLDLRRLRLGTGEIAALPPPVDSAERFPILPPAAVEPTRSVPTEATFGPPHPYRPTQSHVVRLFLSETGGPSGSTFQAGLEGSDVVGRFHWIASGSVGNAAGPRGGAVSLAYRGWPVTLRVSLFSSLERPGAQAVFKRPEFDQERRGGFVEGEWQRPVEGGEVRLALHAGSSRVESLDPRDTFRRDVAALRARGAVERSRGRFGAVLGWDLTGSSGRTEGSSWTQGLAGASLTALAGKVRLRLSGKRGETRGSPTRFDLLSIGGAPSSILPAGLDSNRILMPALPADVQIGRKAETWRVDVSPYEFPMSLFYERARAWSSSEAKPPAVRIYGAEMRLDESLLKFVALGSFDFYAGIARIESRLPSFHSTRLYAGVVYHP